MKTLHVLRPGAIALLLCVQASAMAATFTHDSFISFSDPSYDGQDIVVTNCTLTVDGAHTFNSVQLINGGVLTHSPFPYGPQLLSFSVFNEPQVLSPTNATPLDNTNIDTSSIAVFSSVGGISYTENVDYVVTISNNVTFLTLTTNSAIAAGSTVLVNYDWITSFDGFQLTISNNFQIDPASSINISGKGYGGGIGFQNGTGASQPTNYPFAFTAGGGGAHGGRGGMSSTFARGGASYDSVTNPVSAGSGGGLSAQPGGAGGGVASLVVGGNLQIDGQILANGFKGTNAHCGGGAGGSLFISATSLGGVGTIAANGGSGDLPDGGGGGGGRISIYYGTNNFTGNTTAFGGNGANAGGAGTVYLQSIGNPGAQLFIVNGGERGTNTPFSSLGVLDLHIGGGAVAQSQSSGLFLTNLFVGSNSWLTMDPMFPLLVTVTNNATIESNGVINADSKASAGPGTGTFISCSAGAGGSFGGYGGSSVCGAASGATYGSLTQPASFGSAGTLYGGGSKPAARGGGIIQMTVLGTLSLAGKISANGEPATFATTGAGSGGSVWLNTGVISGGGTISANGGSASNLVSGAGGGGRIAVYYNSNFFTGNIQAQGGSGTNNGGPGSVYLKQNNGLLPQVIFDNGGRVGKSSLPVGFNPFNLRISGGTILSNFNASFFTLGNLFIGSNSWFALSSVYNMNILVQTNATIQPTGGITADGISSSTLGAGSSFAQFGGGGGNGGNGGAGNIGSTNAPGGQLLSGTITEPTNLGGMGGAGVPYPSNFAGGKGGGIISLNVLGTLQLDGAISANGTTGPSFNSGGGAGGSIVVAARLLSGAGIISANGGAANNLGGGGGGGRIAVTCTSNSFTGHFTAYGGAGANYGGAGTIFVGRPATLPYLNPSQLIIDNGGQPGAVTPLASLIGQSLALTISGGASVSNSFGGTMQLVNLLVGTNSILQLFPSTQEFIEVTSNVTVQAGGSINADAVAGTISGPGPGQTLNSTGGGGGGAGTGGNSAVGAIGGAGFTDQVTSPTTSGARGGPGAYLPTGAPNTGANGGGAFHLTVTGTLRVDGRISADGGAASTLNGGGGGGGSVMLSSRIFSGSGTISANGGAGNAGGGGGGGGHLSIVISSNAFTGTITAHGGSGANYGGAGLVYMGPNAALPGQPLPLPPFLNPTSTLPVLVADNGGVQGSYTPLPNPFSPSIPVNTSLTITGGAILTNGTGVTLQNLLIGSNSVWLLGSTTSQFITVSTNATIQAGGWLDADGAIIAGPAQGQTFFATGGGGGHGGYGALSLSNALGGLVTPDPIGSPSGTGSRGGTGQIVNSGGSGGGALQFVVRGTLQVDGKISANGFTGSALNSGGGSGGSLWLQVNKLSGAGNISANGGAGNNIGGGGGGGRVAIWYNTNSFSGAITARGGAGGNYGGAGTIYTIASTLGQGRPPQIVIDNGGVRATNTPIVNVTASPDLIIGNGASAVVSGSSNPAWNSLTISSNALLSIDPQLTGMTLVIQSNATIQPGGAFSLDAHGYLANIGPGAGISAAAGSSGGSHGGDGSAGAGTNFEGAAYDFIQNPSQPGSGGGSPKNLQTVPGPGSGSAGGGALHLTVNGILTVNGSISANGGSGIAQGAGGGAGGALWLNANTIAGSGSISANGGDGEFYGTGGGGGGGRIAVYFTSNRFTGTFSAQGGAGPFLAGGAGTIYLKTNAFFTAKLVLDNGGQPGADTPLSLPATQVLPFVDLYVQNGAVASGSQPLTFQDLYIGDGGVISADAATLLNLSVINNATISTNGAIDADVHLGSDPGPGAGSVDVYGDGSGGGYGGAGGASFFGAPGGVPYGSSNAPTSLGSAGGSSPTLPGYSQGGGAVEMNVHGALTINGTISANGNDGIIDGSGGGSGGSIYITAKSLAGSGSITANGGMGESMEGGGGGGGRIAVILSTNSFSGTILASGGAGAYPGQDGTILVATDILISGIVRDTNGAPVVGLSVPSSSAPFGVTDFNGFYFMRVPMFWNGTVGPAANSQSLPATRTYSNLTTDQSNQDFTVVPTLNFNLTPGQFDGTNINFSFYGIHTATYQLLCSSNLVDWVPYGPPIIGSNAAAVIAVPPTNAPQMFFRLSAH